MFLFLGLTLIQSALAQDWVRNFDAWVDEQSHHAPEVPLQGVWIPSRFIDRIGDRPQNEYLRPMLERRDLRFVPFHPQTLATAPRLIAWLAEQGVTARLEEHPQLRVRFGRSKLAYLKYDGLGLALHLGQGRGTVRHAVLTSEYLDRRFRSEYRGNLSFVPDNLGYAITGLEEDYATSIQDWTDIAASSLQPTISSPAEFLADALAEWIQFTGLVPTILNRDTALFKIVRNRRGEQVRVLVMRRSGSMLPLIPLFAAGQRDFSTWRELDLDPTQSPREIRLLDSFTAVSTDAFQSRFAAQFEHWTQIQADISQRDRIRISQDPSRYSGWIQREIRACAILNVIKAAEAAKRSGSP